MFFENFFIQIETVKEINQTYTKNTNSNVYDKKNTIFKHIKKNQDNLSINNFIRLVSVDLNENKLKTK